MVFELTGQVEQMLGIDRAHGPFHQGPVLVKVGDVAEPLRSGP